MCDDYDDDDKLILRAGEAMGIKLQYSDNVGGFSKYEPYSKDDCEWNPLTSTDDAMEISIALDIWLVKHSYGNGAGKDRTDFIQVQPGEAYFVDLAKIEITEGCDMPALIRRAIVLAAIELKFGGKE